MRHSLGDASASNQAETGYRHLTVFSQDTNCRPTYNRMIEGQLGEFGIALSAA